MRLSVAVGFLLINLVLLLLACNQEEYIYPERPDHFAAIDYPGDNLPTKARLSLGKMLFFDNALSLDSTLSCASCHKHEHALADNLPVSLGIDNRAGKRNTPSLYNAGYLDLINKDGGVSHIDLQALVPIEDENEMGISILRVAERLNRNPAYIKQAKEAYNRSPDAYVVTRALGTYIRSLISGDSPYDLYLNGNTSALNASQLAGKNLFFGDRLKCGSCHDGTNLTNNQFENNGLYVTYEDFGRALITQKESDIGKFRVPSLRNVSSTAPYMHDGSLKTLDEVIDHYTDGGKRSKNQSEFITGFEINQEERDQLKAFLASLTGASALDPL